MILVFDIIWHFTSGKLDVFEYYTDLFLSNKVLYRNKSV